MAELAVEALRGLALPATQLRLIRDVIVDSARQISAGGGALTASLPISITLLVAGRQISGASERQGWGSFVIKHRVDSAPAAEVGAHYTIELYLYPEGSRDTPG